MAKKREPRRQERRPEPKKPRRAARTTGSVDARGRIDAILEYWFGSDPGAEGILASRQSLWFCKPEDRPRVDGEIRRLFGEDCERARRGEIDGWAEDGRGALALILLLDQFPRNLFRDDARAFAADDKAVAVMRAALARDLDQKLSVVERMFFYMPLVHSEKLHDHQQGAALRDKLVAEAPPHLAAGIGQFAKFQMIHYRVVERFGRFPHRNAVLGRTSTVEEKEYLANEAQLGRGNSAAHAKALAKAPEQSRPEQKQKTEHVDIVEDAAGKETITRTVKKTVKTVKTTVITTVSKPVSAPAPGASPPKNPNRIAMESCLKAFQAGDTDTLRKFYAPDIEWRVPGTHPLAGTYRGPDAVFGFFGRMMQLTNGTFRTTNYEMLYNDPDGVNGVFVGRLTGEREGKKPLNVELLLRVRFRNGQFSEGADFIYPEHEWNEFWSDPEPAPDGPTKTARKVVGTRRRGGRTTT